MCWVTFLRSDSQVSMGMLSVRERRSTSKNVAKGIMPASFPTCVG